VLNTRVKKKTPHGKRAERTRGGEGKALVKKKKKRNVGRRFRREITKGFMFVNPHGKQRHWEKKKAFNKGSVAMS